MKEQTEKLRVDKWLWHARFYKTRSLASKACQARHIVLNGQSVSKASVMIVVGDRLQFFQGPHLRVVEVVGLGDRRGPAPEAQALYVDHSPPRMPKKETASDIRTAPIAERDAGAGRPTKAERRAIDRLRREDGGA
ncbi:MAG: RNA-binding S4 domain-containing protein [Rhodospirillales bacterium]|nr:RNA-binding S4 domain-containing protein [Rhodospirillales bacterium]